MKSYKIAGLFNQYLIGATVIDSFTAEVSDGLEGGLTIVFEKQGKKGVLILCYNDLGEWLEYLQIGNEKIKDFEHYVYTETIYKAQTQYVDALCVEYEIR